MSLPEIPPGLADVPVAKSAISFIDGKRAILAYRGIPVEVLAKQSHFEETAWLLLKGELPTQRELANFHDGLKKRRALKFRVEELLKALPDTAHPMVALQTAVAALGGFYPAKAVSDKASNWEATLRLLASLPTIVAAFHRIRQGEQPIPPNPDLDHAANFYYMMLGKEPSPSIRKVLDACLILHAEHNMNASTFSARVTSSTLSSPYATVSAAVGTLSGPLHGGANEEVLEMLNEIGPASNVKPWLDKKRAETASYKVMGLGHRVYKVKDPRASVLQELAEHVFAETGRPAKYDVAVTLEKTCEPIYGVKGVYPNVDFYSGVVYESLGIPMDQFTPIFAVARVAGWLAHWHEQLENNRIYRPEQIYTGKTEAAYVPLEKRP
jgi:citrate synthase